MLLGIGKHCYMLYLDRQQMWDYVGDAYAHRLNQAKVDGEVITGMDTRRISLEGGCDACKCSDDSWNWRSPQS